MGRSAACQGIPAFAWVGAGLEPAPVETCGRVSVDIDYLEIMEKWREL